MAVPITPWLATADPRWPTRQVVLDDLHCTVAVPADWQADEPEATDQEQSMTFLGASPVEWLTVRYLASGDGQLNQWLDTVLRAIGFPVLPPSHLLVDLPVLLEGTDQPVGPADLDRLQVDALRLYTASAEWPGGDRRLFRLYVVQARRGSRSWSVELSFDSAVAPGMAHELVEQADDPRAAAVFSDLRLTS